MKIHAHDTYTEWSSCDDCNPWVACRKCGDNMADEWDGDNDPICRECVERNALHYYNQNGGN